MKTDRPYMITLREIEERGMDIDSLPPFISYCLEDKSRFKKASECGYIDPDDDFLIGDSGGILMNISYSFINTNLLSEAAQFYNRTGVYTYAQEDSPDWVRFWAEERKRRLGGFTAPCKMMRDGTIKNLRITGDHYNFLNYSRIQRRLTEEEKADYHSKGNFRTKMISGFPLFYDGHYWRFKLDEFCIVNNLNICEGKIRGVGYSYIHAASDANLMNLVPKAIVGYAAIDESYLTDSSATMDMLKTDLTWYENHTEWQRGFISEDLSHIELGIKESKKGHQKEGYLSVALANSTKNNPKALAGKRFASANIEEAGLCTNLGDVLNMTLSAAEVGDEQVGIIRVFGAPGTKATDWKIFSDVFYNPKRYKMVCMENIWDRDSRMNFCSFFHPRVWTLQGYMDQWGNSKMLEAYIYDQNTKKDIEENSDVTTYYAYVSQRANSPEEAFREGSANLFSSVGLKQHEMNITNNPLYKSYIDGMLVETADGDIIQKPNAVLRAEGFKIHPYIEKVPFDATDDVYGCIRQFITPVKINGLVPDNKFVIVYDPVGKDKDSKEINNKNSLNCAYCFDTETNQIASCYVGRPSTMKEADRIVYMMCLYYNAKCLVEVDRGNTVPHFREWKALRYLFRDPNASLDNKVIIEDSARYGISIGNSKNAELYLLDLKDLLYTENVKKY